MHFVFLTSSIRDTIDSFANNVISCCSRCRCDNDDDDDDDDDDGIVTAGSPSSNLLCNVVISSFNAADVVLRWRNNMLSDVKQAMIEISSM